MSPDITRCPVGDALAAYNLLRAFSWQLRLSPATFAEFCTALGSSQPTALMDEIHLCVLRTLAEDETKATRSVRLLPLDHLDAASFAALTFYIPLLAFFSVVFSMLTVRHSRTGNIYDI